MERKVQSLIHDCLLLQLWLSCGAFMLGLNRLMLQDVTSLSDDDATRSKASPKPKGRPKSSPKRGLKRPARKPPTVPETQDEVPQGSEPEVAGEPSAGSKAKAKGKAKGPMKRPAASVTVGKGYYARDNKFGFKVNGKEQLYVAWFVDELEA